jgi:Domain of unknown function (DUF4926)
VCSKRVGKGAQRRAHVFISDSDIISDIAKLLGVAMSEQAGKSERPAVLDVVALLADLPAQGLARGQVGTVVESLDERTALLEFTDDQGRAYAIASCARSDLLVLHYVPQAA